MDSIDDDDVRRVERDHVDPNATREQEIQAALAEAGIEGNSADAFAELMVSQEDVEAAVDTRGRDITTREDVQKALDRTDTSKRSGTRDDALVDEAAREIGAPSESALQQARGSALQNLDGDTLRSDPDLDPLAEGGQGREVADLSEAGSLGKEGGVRTTVEKRGDRGVYVAEDAEGNRYPLAEVDL